MSAMLFLWVLLPMLFNPAHLVVRVEDEGGSVRGGVVVELVVRDVGKKGAFNRVLRRRVEGVSGDRSLNRLRDKRP